MKRKLIFLLICGNIFCTISFSQNDCRQVLLDAKKLFEAGKISDVVSSIESCEIRNLAKEDRFEAYHLLAIAYQTLNNETAMDKNIRLMLKLRPNYKKFPNIDPLDFTNVLKKYSVRHLLYAGLEVGINSTGVDLVKSYSVFSSTQRYLPVKSFQLGLMADYRIIQGLSIKLNASFLGLGINHVVDSANGWSQEYNEQQRIILLSLSCLKYFTLHKDLKLFAGVGAGYNSLISAQVNLVSENFQDQSIRLATRNAFNERNKSQISILPQVGLNYAVADGYIGVNIIYSQFLKTTVDASKRLNDENFIFNNQYINDDIKLKMLTVSICYTKTVLYKTSKLP